MNFKKKLIAASIALASVSAFAEWDYYPVLDEHHGQVKLTTEYWYSGDEHSLAEFVEGRFTIVKGLEVSLKHLGYQFFDDPNDEAKENNGLTDITVGVKYSFNNIFSVFADAAIPTGSDDVSNETFSLSGGISWLLPISEQFGIGNEFKITRGFEHDDIKPGLVSTYGLEAYYSFKNGFTPFFGWAFTSQLTDTEYADGSEGGTTESNVSFWAGASYSVNPYLTFTLYEDIEYIGEAYLGGFIFNVSLNF
ncbi:MAG: hypothetical protein J6Z31_09415 [Fibrobacter sp.]|nr:hypothetical protein [Fibrobacter sp.]